MDTRAGSYTGDQFASIISMARDFSQEQVIPKVLLNRYFKTLCSYSLNILSTLVSISDFSLMPLQILSTSPAHFFLPNRPEEEACGFQPTKHVFGIFPLNFLSKARALSIQPPNNSVKSRRLPSLLLMSPRLRFFRYS
jgi:hypothetical protein